MWLLVLVRKKFFPGMIHKKHKYKYIFFTTGYGLLLDFVAC